MGHFAHFNETELSHANLQETNLIGSCFQNASLSGANMQKANLTYTDFRCADLTTAKLQKSILRDSNLQRAYFGYANLQGADLTDAKLQGTSFKGADLRNCVGINIKQLSKVETLYKTKLDPDIENQIKERYPHLLKEITDEEEASWAEACRPPSKK